MDNTKVINLGLVFEDRFSRMLEQYSQDLSVKMPGSYVLGINSIPHISVVQLLDSRSPEHLWDLAEKVLKQPIQVKLKGLYFDPEQDSKRVWFGLRVALTDDLMVLQRNLINEIKPDAVINGKGVGYFPHVTMGYSMPCEELSAIPFGDLPTILDTVPCRLAMGRSGPDYQFAEKIYGC